MPNQPTTPLLIALSITATLHAQAQQIVVPATRATTDATSHLWLPGAANDVRQQTLIGESHLTAMIGKTIHAIEFRRTAADEIYTGGLANMVIALSTSTQSTLEASSTFASNIGSAPQQVFTGTVTFPTSPPGTGATVAWSPDNIVRIQFTTPFSYTGGRLCLDVTGTPIAGQSPGWWMADAEFEDIPGTVTNLGGGCGPHANSSFVAEYSLMVGGYAKMFAYGSPDGLAIAAIGQPGSPVPLSILGFATPGNCNLMLGTLDILVPTIFLTSPDPLAAPFGARADFELKIPNVPGAQGLTLATQWFDWTQLATTNAVEWTITSTPTIDMAAVEGHPLETNGNVSIHQAHVIRFEYQ